MDQVVENDRNVILLVISDLLIYFSVLLSGTYFYGGWFWYQETAFGENIFDESAEIELFAKLLTAFVVQNHVCSAAAENNWRSPIQHSNKLLVVIYTGDYTAIYRISYDNFGKNTGNDEYSTRTCDVRGSNGCFTVQL